MKTILLILVGVGFLFFIFNYAKDTIKHRQEIFNNKKVSTVKGVISGFVFFMLDALGVGSFATSTAFFNYTKYVDDVRYYPATLNISSVIPTTIQVFAFVTIINVDVKLIFLCLIFAMLGGYVGPKIVYKLNANVLSAIIALSLLYVSMYMLLNIFGVFGKMSFSASITVSGYKLLILTLCAFLFAALGSFGIGSYALYIILFYILGISPIATWPVMSVATCCRTYVSSYAFIKKGLYKRKQSFLMTFSGIFGVIVAVLLLQEINIKYLVLIASFVIFSAGITIGIKAIKNSQQLKM
jgi:uncharacterized membrane protein YfcA